MPAAGIRYYAPGIPAAIAVTLRTKTPADEAA
jgi:hypothetical protein